MDEAREEGKASIKRVNCYTLLVLVQLLLKEFHVAISETNPMIGAPLVWYAAVLLLLHHM